MAASEGGSRLARAAYGAYLVVILLITLLPAEQAGQVTGIVSVVAWWIDPLVPFEVGYVVLEFFANIALFVPFGALLALGWPEQRWWLIGLAGLAVSGVIEAAQLLLPSRFPAVSDLIANTLGALLGGILVGGFQALIRRRRSSLEA